MGRVGCRPARLDASTHYASKIVTKYPHLTPPTASFAPWTLPTHWGLGEGSCGLRHQTQVVDGMDIC